MASGTSPSVSKQHFPMQGPTAARMRSGLAPSRRTISRTVFSTIPAAQPRHPAWTAPTHPASGSWSRRMPQSAENTTRGIPGVSVTMASTLV